MARGRVPDSGIAAIHERTPIKEVAAEYVNLKPAGTDSLKKLSPFRDKRTPSFHICPNYGYYHYSSTGKGGDALSLLMEAKHLSFPGTVEACTKEVGSHINYGGGGTSRHEESETRQCLIATNRETQEFYCERFSTPTAASIREFLESRGFTTEHAVQFGCGYSPAGRNTLTKHPQRLGFSLEESDKAGLPKMGRMGPTDRFRRRLTWSIHNVSGDIIGLGARKLFDDDNLGKYTNTPKTMLYKKSKMFFGLDLARKDIAASHQAVVVEGYTDVMVMHASGVITAVISYSVAFGEEHLQLLHHLMLDDNFFHGEFICALDGDEAGQRATTHASEGERSFTGQSYIAVMPDGTNPCDLHQKKGEVIMRDLAASRRPLVESVPRTFLANYDLTTVNGRVSGLYRVIPVLAQLKDMALCDEYAREVASWIGWNDEAELM